MFTVTGALVLSGGAGVMGNRRLSWGERHAHRNSNQCSPSGDTLLKGTPLIPDGAVPEDGCRTKQMATTTDKQT